MKKPELLSPAGNYEALMGAINAGADAVYLGGEFYGARAYADNFTQDEILSGLHMAHLFGRKIYLTVNTLVKEKELDGLYDFLTPFYENGLDGVIVQDLGVMRYIRKHFPKLPIHASTQMTLTGSYGAECIKQEGISRIVPARELSLEEIRKIKRETDLEIEAFIHGAMCYCYSGQCLFSSILGGRSGNRGRCAQPCRLPYKSEDGEDCFPLSMRDMRTIHLLPKLIDAGIDSFKIEGRMKKPAYAAGVTAIYRKYIDLYEKDGDNYQVDKKDLEVLNALYIRSETGDGYYMRRNGKEMISLSSPAYCATEEKLLSEIKARYLDSKMTICAKAEISLTADEAARLTLTVDKKALSSQKSSGARLTPQEDFAVTATCKGDVVQKAVKQPLTPDKITEQIQKSGNSFIQIDEVNVNLNGPVFLPVKALNELRRRCVAALETAVIEKNGFDTKGRKAVPETAVSKAPNPVYGINVLPKQETDKFDERTAIENNSRYLNDKFQNKARIHVSVQTASQLEAAMEAQASRIYLDYHLLAEPLFQTIPKGRIRELLPAQSEVSEQVPAQSEIYAATPYIVRDNNIRELEILAKAFTQGKIDGVLVRNLEGYQFLSRHIPFEKLVIDTGLYVWNRESLLFWEQRAGEFYLPLEGKRQEWEELLRSMPCRRIKASAVVYGRLPMMITANCLKKTSGKCDKTPETLTLTDRYEKQFPVYTDCRSCYNVIYNSVPLSLHRMFTRKASGKSSEGKNGESTVREHTASRRQTGENVFLRDNFRLDFTVENRKETKNTIGYFQDLLTGYREPFYKEYTTGHYKRGVE